MVVSAVELVAESAPGAASPTLRRKEQPPALLSHWASPQESASRQAWASEQEWVWVSVSA